MELAELIIGYTGSSSRIVHKPSLQDDPRQRCPDISKASEILDWKPQVDLRNGLMHTIGYFDKLLTLLNDNQTGKENSGSNNSRFTSC
jgi:UDP-glucuronate decarboxylase